MPDPYDAQEFGAFVPPGLRDGLPNIDPPTPVNEGGRLSPELLAWLETAPIDPDGRTFPLPKPRRLIGKTRVQSIAEPAKTEAVSGERFVRAWLQLDKLPGCMMVGPEGRFGPVPASRSCWVTTSERERDRLLAKGEPMLEVWTTAPLTPEAGPVQQKPAERCGYPACGCRPEHCPLDAAEPAQQDTGRSDGKHWLDGFAGVKVQPVQQDTKGDAS